MSQERTAKEAARELLSLTGWELTFSPAQPAIVFEMLTVLLETSPVEVEHDTTRGTITIRRKAMPCVVCSTPFVPARGADPYACPACAPSEIGGALLSLATKDESK